MRYWLGSLGLGSLLPKDTMWSSGKGSLWSQVDPIHSSVLSPTDCKALSESQHSHL